MNAKESTTKSQSRIEAGIRGLSKELNREDSDLRSCLLDAALAGLRLTRNPESRELRRDAVQIWAAIEPILSHHLDAEDRELLPWLGQQGRLSPELGRNVRECHDKLRTLIGAIAKTGADRLTQAEARDAGRPWECGKSFDQSAPISAIVRTGPAALPSQAGISLRVNGVVRQQAILGDMIWNCDEIVSRLSLLYALEPGDLIFTGTPAGVADLNPGDRVEAFIEGVAELTFRVAPHKPSSSNP